MSKDNEPIDLVTQQQEIRATKVCGPITVGNVVDRIPVDYNFNGQAIENLHPLTRGLETQKYTFWCENELYLLKIYSQSLSHGYRFRLRNLGGLERKLKQAGVPLPETIRTTEGYFFSVIKRVATPNLEYSAAFSISKIFLGSALENPTTEDVQQLSFFMARIHNIKDFGVVSALDNWSILKLVQTYDRGSYKEGLREYRAVVKPIVEAVRNLGLGDKTRFPHTLIHGDLHKFNILKSPDGEYCILDLGCLDYGPRIVDLAVFMANTCADLTDLQKTKALFDATIEAYEKTNLLTPAEKEAIPLLIKANYAIFYLRTSEILLDDPNDQEVREWHKFAAEGLSAMDKLALNLPSSQ